MSASLQRSLCCVGAVCTLLLCITSPGSAADDPPRPNIVLVVADDLGYGDLGCYGQKWIRTPHLDRMAEEGLRFTQHYAGSTVCAPSRACLLTGLHTGHVSVRGNVEVLLSDEETTVAEVLSQSGYATAAIGKWGVGHPPPPGDPARNGFDDFFGYLDMWHAHNYYPDFLWRNGAKVSIKGNVVRTVGRGGVALKRTHYSHDLFTEEALKYVRGRAEQDDGQPFFLYLAFTIPHANNEAGEKGMEVPSDEPYGKQAWPQPQKNHAAMITRLDESVGKLTTLLRELNLDRNTLVIFTSDNGPHAEGGADPKFFDSSGGLRGHKRDLYEGGIRVPCIAWWPGTIEGGRTTGHVSSFWDFLPTAAELAGTEPPAGVDGLSYVPVLLGRTDQQQEHAQLYWEFHEGRPAQAVRKGTWKLVRLVGRPPELYDLQSDVAETKDLAAEHPALVRELEAILAAEHTKSAKFPLEVEE